jgi:uncharacterized protein YcbX
MLISSIHTYPVKGCYRVDHDRAEVQRWGLAGDRRWMIVDALTGKAITQRQVPGLTQIRPQTVADGLVLRTPGLADLRVDAPVAGSGDGGHIAVRVWRFTGPAALAGPLADDWLSDVLRSKVRLVFLDDPSIRAVNPDLGEPGDTVSFADGYPVLLANTASLDALNDLIAESGSLEGPLPMARFRPNLVITGAPAWVEDEWTGGRIRIGDLTFRVPKPCDRCVVTTTDQETGERGREPLLTLARHRKVDQKLLFATNLIPDAAGAVSVGNAVEPL